MLGGQSGTGTISLTGAAGAGGDVVSLSSSNSAVVVPVSVTVPQNSTSVSFSVTTSSVQSRDLRRFARFLCRSEQDRYVNDKSTARSLKWHFSGSEHNRQWSVRDRNNQSHRSGRYWRRGCSSFQLEFGSRQRAGVGNRSSECDLDNVCVHGRECEFLKFRGNNRFLFGFERHSQCDRQSCGRCTQQHRG